MESWMEIQWPVAKYLIKLEQRLAYVSAGLGDGIHSIATMPFPIHTFFFPHLSFVYRFCHFLTSTGISLLFYSFPLSFFLSLSLFYGHSNSNPLELCLKGGREGKRFGSRNTSSNTEKRTFAAGPFHDPTGLLKHVGRTLGVWVTKSDHGFHI